MDLVRRQDPPLRRPKPMVFPLPIFELASNMKLPADKKELVSECYLFIWIIEQTVRGVSRRHFTSGKIYKLHNYYSTDDLITNNEKQLNIKN